MSGSYFHENVLTLLNRGAHGVSVVPRLALFLQPLQSNHCVTVTIMNTTIDTRSVGRQSSAEWQIAIQPVWQPMLSPCDWAIFREGCQMF